MLTKWHVKCRTRRSFKRAERKMAERWLLTTIARLTFGSRTTLQKMRASWHGGTTATRLPVFPIALLSQMVILGNHEHIAFLGRTLTSPEKDAHRIIRHLADYVLVWAGGGGDDLAKSPHLRRIANSVYRGLCDEPTCRDFGFYVS